ncbi:MAG: sugar kinase [Acidimicrobiia bacterium]
MTRRSLATVGEGQIRLTLPAGVTFERAAQLNITTAGSELNVATLLARVGWETRWHSILPRSPLGRRIVADVEAAGCEAVVTWREEGRVALYWLDPGNGPISASVTYDREHTPFREMTVEDLDWGRLLGSDVVYLSGITAALTPATGAVVQAVAQRAKESGSYVVFDVNHRDKLWSVGAAVVFLESVSASTDLVFCSVRDAGKLLGITGDDGRDVAARLRATLGVPEVVVSHGTLPVAYASAAAAAVAPVLATPVRDRPGAGDAFIAGFLADPSADPETRLKMATRAAAHALSQFGDQTHVTLDQLRTPLGGGIDR